LGRAALAVGALSIGSLVRGAPVEAVADPGLGQASAQLLRIEPTSAGLSFGIIVAPISSDHRNDVARAVAQSTNFGLVGAALTGESCTGADPAIPPEALPKVLRTDSRDADAGTAKSVVEGPVTETVVADGRPDARSTGRLADLGLPGIVSLAGLSERTRSGLDADGIREATAHAEAADVVLLGGLVELHAITWDGRQHGTQGATGTFAIGGASIAGSPVPTQDPDALLEAVNAVTSPLGVTVAPPEVREIGDSIFVDPLTIAVVPNAGRDAVAATLLAGAQPLREAVFGALIDADCGNAAYITVLDILLGSITGSGTFKLSIGGVDAGSSAVDGFAFAGATRLVPPTPAGPAESSGSALAPAPVAAQPTTAGRTAPVAASVEDVSDGALAVALVALVLGAVLVELDRRTIARTP
jgi:hypothetical protein